jgi:adenosine kinase
MSHGRIIVGGSIAYDNIVRFPGRFEDNILPDQVQALNVSFLVDSMKRIQGGTGANIAYNLALVGEKPVLMGTAGKDFAEYRRWLQSHGVDTGLTRVVEDDYTASCTIITDLGHNQITSFYPGAMDRDREISLLDVPVDGLSMVVIAPTEPGAMIRWALECQQRGLPYLFDPGMQIPRLTRDDLVAGIRGARLLVLNEYEYHMMQNKTGLTRQEILGQAETLVITLGARGSIIAWGSEEEVIPAAKPQVLVNPTGVGDAFRAGLLKGYLEGRPLSVMGRMGSVSAVYAVEHQGATEHSYTLDEFYQRYEENFGGVEHVKLRY